MRKRSCGLATAVILLALGAAVSGCGMFSGGPAKLAKPTPVAAADQRVKLSTAWQARLYGGWRVDPYQATQVAVAGDRIVVGDSRGNVIALSGAGRELWRRQLDGRISAGGTIAGDRVYVGNDAGFVTALSLSQGQVLWRSALSSEVITRVLPAGDRLLVQTNDGKLWSLSAKDGAQQWSYSATIPSLSLRGAATPLADQDTVYAAFSSGELAALDARDGHLLWQVPVATPRGRTELERLVDADATPVLMDDSIIAGTYQGKLGAFNRSSGAESWSRDMSVFNPLLLANDRLYLTDAQDVLYAIDPRTGATLWRNDQMQGRGVTGPALVQGTLLVGDRAGYLFAFDPESGRRIGQARIAATGLQSAPVAFGDGALALSREGSLYRLRVARR